MTELLVETIELDTDESNELLFKINIEGHVAGPTKIRLVCESEDMSYMFPGRQSEEKGLVQFIVHKAAGLKEGTYPARIEVLVENRFFVPVNFNIEMKKTVTVVAEAIKLVKREQEVRVTASPVIKKKPIVVESVQRTLADRYKNRKP